MLALAMDMAKVASWRPESDRNCFSPPSRVRDRTVLVIRRITSGLRYVPAKAHVTMVRSCALNLGKTCV